MDESFYEASDGHEYFLQMIDPTDRTIFALLRLRVPSQYFSGEDHYIKVLNRASIVRELHVFGDQIPVGRVGNNSGQHMGFGKRLMARAEEIVRTQYPTIEHIAVIAGA
jgi:elongator complex protein 3